MRERERERREREREREEEEEEGDGEKKRRVLGGDVIFQVGRIQEVFSCMQGTVP